MAPQSGLRPGLLTDFLQFSFCSFFPLQLATPFIYSFIVWDPRAKIRVHFKRQRNPQPISKEIRKVAETIYLINLPAFGIPRYTFAELYTERMTEREGYRQKGGMVENKVKA